MIVTRNRATAVLFDFLRSLPSGGSFLLPANVCPIVPLVFMKARRPFEFIDIDATTFGMSQHTALERLRSAGDDVAGLLYVRPYGDMRDLSAFFGDIRSIRRDLVLIDDCCLARPRTVPPGNQLSDLMLFSTGYAKYVDLGFGGYGFLSGPHQIGERSADDFLAADLDALTQAYKSAVRDGHALAYCDSKWLDLSPLRSSLGEYFDLIEGAKLAADRQKALLNDIYSSLIPRTAQLPAPFQSWRFNVRVQGKSDLLEKIERAGMFASSHYAPLDGVLGPGCGTEAKRIYAALINFFNDKYFDEPRAIRLAAITKQHIESH